LCSGGGGRWQWEDPLRGKKKEKFLDSYEKAKMGSQPKRSLRPPHTPTTLGPLRKKTTEDSKPGEVLKKTMEGGGVAPIGNAFHGEKERS